MPIIQAVPVLRVADVARTIAWYRTVLGFVGDPFPATPPHVFAILRHGTVEIMVRRSEGREPSKPCSYDWDVYLRLEATDFRAVFSQLNKAGLVTRRLERMPYGQAEFEITDPDGYVICLSQVLADAHDLPVPSV